MGLLGATVAWLTAPASWSGAGGIPARLLEHVAISAISLALAAALALPLGLWIGHTGRGARLAVGLANLGRAVPTLAVIAIVLPLTQALDPQLGFVVYPTVAAMVVLALPPMLVNAATGIAEVDRELVEAARGQGLRERQLLTEIELPLALPVVVGGIRSAAVQVIATATLGAIFGFGGLGRFLVDGVAQRNDAMVWGGVALVAALVVAAEAALALGGRLVAGPGVTASSSAMPSPT